MFWLIEFTPSDAASVPSCNPVSFSVMDLVFPHSLLGALKEFVPPIFLLFRGALLLCFIGRMLTLEVQPKPPHTGECIKEKPNHSKYLPLSLPPYSLWVSPLRLAESCPCYPSSHTCLTHTHTEVTNLGRKKWRGIAARQKRAVKSDRISTHLFIKENIYFKNPKLKHHELKKTVKQRWF